MKVRIRFSKTGALIYIGHLDVMRYFQKLFRRSQIPVAYSEGFSPHQILSFTPPLPLGMESCGEYADVTLTDEISTFEALRALRTHSVPEIEIMSFRRLPEKCENAMASVRASEYEVSVTCDPEEIQKSIDALMEKDELIVLKKTKKNEQFVNIRGMIHKLELKNNGIISMLLSSGSSDNLKPVTVMEELGKIIGKKTADTDMTIRRTDQFAMHSSGLISLNDIGEDIP